MALLTRTDSYLLRAPKVQGAGVIFSSPHSGRDYPADFLARSVLNEQAIRSSEDFWVDRLVSIAPALGCPLLCARKPRAYIDLNRAMDELDPAVIEGIAPRSLNPRVLAGLGVIPRVVAHARAIYRGKLSREEADFRLRHYWQPYHEKLQQLIEESRAYFGTTLVLDCHSMPNEAARLHSNAKNPAPDIILGDRYGASAQPNLVAIVERAFQSQGFLVARNSPFAGGFITQNYGRPAFGVSVIQIEINRSLYMNEALIAPRNDFHDFKRKIGRIMSQIISEMPKEKRLAAE